MQTLRDARPEQAQPFHRQDPNDARRGRGLARRQGGLQRAAARPAPGLGRGQLAHRAAARQPGLRRRRARRRRRADDPGLHVHLTLRPGATTSPRRSSHARAAQGRDPARAGRQLARRDGYALHRGRLRRLRRAHDRPAGRPRAARPVPGLRRLRRLQLRRHAGRRRRLGALDHFQPARWPSSSRPSSRAPTPSRWACATAAR